VHCKDSKRRLNGRNGRLGSHLPWADPRRGWDFISTGRGDVPWEDAMRMLNHIGYDGPLSVAWEDAGMDRLIGAPEALEVVRRLSFKPPAAACAAALSSRCPRCSGPGWRRPARGARDASCAPPTYVGPRTEPGGSTMTMRRRTGTAAGLTL